MLRIVHSIGKFLNTKKLLSILILVAILIISFSPDIVKVIISNLPTFKSDAFTEGVNQFQDLQTFCLLFPTWVRILLITVFIFFAFCWCYYGIIKSRKYRIIKHSSQKETQYELKFISKKPKEIIFEELNLSDKFNALKDYKEISYIVNLQDEFISNFIKDINDKDVLGYLGIAHTPLIFRMGYQFGSALDVSLFHKKRDLKTFNELPKSKNFPELNTEVERLTDSNELIVAISTTFPIEQYHLAVLNPEKNNVLQFGIENKGFDVIDSVSQIRDYKDKILKRVRDIVRIKDIKKIHLVISSSVALTFLLAQNISSSTYDPEVIVYHFDNNTPEKYPWGISISRRSSECLVINEKVLYNVQ